MPQTREHFAICRLLQIPAGLIALTKSDLVDAETLELARLDARELVAGSALADAPIVAVSARTGAGLDRLREGLEAIAARAPERAGDGPPRLPIDRVFSMRGFGTVVTGTLTSGTLRADEDLAVLPAGAPRQGARPAGSRRGGNGPRPRGAGWRSTWAAWRWPI